MNRLPAKAAAILLCAGLLVAVFPWVFEMDRRIGGVPVSLRTLGNVVAASVGLLGVSLLFSRRMREAATRAVDWLDALSEGRKRGIVAAGTLLYLAGSVSHKLRAHIQLSTHAQDLGVFSNLCWNIINGNGGHSSFYGIDFLSVHANLILWPLSLLYAVWADARVLLIAQSVFIGLAVPFLWSVAARANRSFSLGGLVALMFLSAKCVGEIVENDFHPDAWVIPTTMAALWAWQKGRKGAVVLFGALSLLAKEDACVAMAAFAIVLFFQPDWKKTAVTLFLICAGVFLIYTKVLIPAHTPDQSESLLFFRYTFGDSYGEWFRNLFLHPGIYVKAFFHHPEKFIRMGVALFPTAGLVFLAPLLLIPAFISVLPHLLSHHATQLSLGDIYVTHAQPYLFVAAGFGLARLLAAPRVRPHRSAVMGVCLLVAGISAFNSPRYYRKQPPERLAAFQEAKRLVPPGASLAVQQNMYAHFDCRKDVQLFPMRATEPQFHQQLMTNPEYVLCDLTGNASPFNREDLDKDVEKVRSNPAYRTYFAREDVVLFRRTTDEPLVYR